jgi:NAD(P)-dependent dehydrogenase (short-subunit alcohol dehydrogenase family)
MAEGLVEAGGTGENISRTSSNVQFLITAVHCLDRLPEPSEAYHEAKKRVKHDWGGGLEYHQVDVSDAENVAKVIAKIADQKQRLDGLIAGMPPSSTLYPPELILTTTAAGIQQVCSALDFPADDIRKMLDVNYVGVFLSARECARQMHKYKIQGSICLIASMSGTIANKGFIAPVYNSSKAAVIQLARNLAMEWGRIQPDGSGGIRVNSLSPGHIMTPMVKANFERGEADRKAWEENSMLGRISEPEEYKAAGLFLLSRASSFMVSPNLQILNCRRCANILADRTESHH